MKFTCSYTCSYFVIVVAILIAWFKWNQEEDVFVDLEFQKCNLEKASNDVIEWEKRGQYIEIAGKTMFVVDSGK